MKIETTAFSSPQIAGWKNKLELALVLIGAATLFLLMGLSVSDALLRSFFNSPIFGANDYGQILLSFVVAASFPLCTLSGRLIAIDTLVRLIPRRMQSTIDWMMTALGVAILSYVSWRAFVNASEAALFGETTLLLQLPYGPTYYAVSAGCASSALILLYERLTR